MMSTHAVYWLYWHNTDAEDAASRQLDEQISALDMRVDRTQFTVLALLVPKCKY